MNKLLHTQTPTFHITGTDFWNTSNYSALSIMFLELRYAHCYCHSTHTAVTVRAPLLSPYAHG